MATSVHGGCGQRGVADPLHGVEGAWGNVEPKGRYLAGFDPYVVDPTGGMAAPVQLVRNSDDAIRFLGRGEAEACYHAAPADALLGPGATPDRPVGVPGRHRVRAQQREEFCRRRRLEGTAPPFGAP